MQADSVDDWTVVPDSSLVVARTVRRDNTTRYTVNGRNASPGEVKQMLLGRGIDLTHNRFLILQASSRFGLNRDELRLTYTSSFSAGRSRVDCSNEAEGGDRA